VLAQPLKWFMVLSTHCCDQDCNGRATVDSCHETEPAAFARAEQINKAEDDTEYPYDLAVVVEHLHQCYVQTFHPDDDLREPFAPGQGEP